MAGKRLSERETTERVMEAYEARYGREVPLRQEEWVRLCHTKYGDKSEQQYCQYFTQAREMWENGLQNKLEKMLVPAANHLRELLEDPDPRVRSDAIKMVMKYTGRDIERKLIKAEVNNITIGFGTEE
jgi:predicted GH43/DUF377 family glycosyl hydrolase